MFRPFLASDTVRFVGDIVAVVLADSREASVDASELVEIDYEPLPAVTDPVEAAKDEVLLFPEVGTNVCLAVPPAEPDPAPARVERRARQGPGHLAAHLGLSDRATRLGRSVRRGRTDHVVDLVPDAPPGQDVPGHDARPG